MKHLFFVDDSIIFSKATFPKAQLIRNIFHDYASASGQVVNLSKSSLFFSPNTLRAIKDNISSWLQVENIGGQNKFLSLPAVVFRSKSHTVEFIKAKITNKITGWKESLSS